MHATNSAIIKNIEQSNRDKSGLTMRAAEVWESPRFWGFSLLGVFRFEGESTLRPASANAGRSALNGLEKKPI